MSIFGKTKRKTNMNILEKANEIVNLRSEEKERQYGPFAECNEKAAKIASLISGKEFTALDIYHFQIALKLARESFSHKQDNLLDAAAYIGALDNYYQGIEPGKEIDPERQYVWIQTERGPVFGEVVESNPFGDLTIDSEIGRVYRTVNEVYYSREEAELSGK